MAWKVTGNRINSDGPVQDLYVLGAFSEAETRNAAAREQLVNCTVQYVQDSEVPRDAWRVTVPGMRSSRISGSKRSLEAMGNSDLVRRPVRTLAVGMGLGVFGGLVLYTLCKWVVGQIFGGISTWGR